MDSCKLSLATDLNFSPSLFNVKSGEHRTDSLKVKILAYSTNPSADVFFGHVKFVAMSIRMRNLFWRFLIFANSLCAPHESFICMPGPFSDLSDPEPQTNGSAACWQRPQKCWPARLLLCRV